jgi:hypothetical protein
MQPRSVVKHFLNVFVRVFWMKLIFKPMNFK